MNPEHCEVKGCTREAEFDSPAWWCQKHWNMWFNWPEGEEEPYWFPKFDEEVKAKIDETEAE